MPNYPLSESNLSTLIPQAATMPSPVVRRGRRSDSREFLRLVDGLAAFEKLQPPDEAAKRRMVEDVFRKRRLGLFVATMAGTVVGYALYYFAYSSFLARQTLYLEDIFVLGEARGNGVGSALFRRCVREARERGCGKMEWAVLDWNRRAIRFYEKAGAKSLREWQLYRLSSEQFEAAERGE